MINRQYAKILHKHYCRGMLCTQCFLDKITEKSCSSYVDSNPDEVILKIISFLLKEGQDFPVENPILKI